MNKLSSKEYVFATIFFSFILAGWSCKTRSSNADNNKKLILAQFHKWEKGTGSLFNLLAKDAIWKIAGSGPGVLSGTYNSKTAYINEVVNPIQAKLAKRLTPKLISILAEGDDVVVIWESHSTAMDGKPYHNTYSWIMT